MTNNRFSQRDGALDDSVADAIRTLLAPPGGEGYWTELEGSIMARLGAADLGWWEELTHWARPALVAAAALIVVASAAMLRTDEAQAHAVYEDVVAMTELPDDVVARPPVDQADLEENMRDYFAP